MEYVSTNYSEEELAWVSPEITLQRDIYLMITLKRPGKLVIRQDRGDGKKPRVPIRAHKNMDKFYIRMRINCISSTIFFFLLWSSLPSPTLP